MRTSRLLLISSAFALVNSTCKKNDQPYQAQNKISASIDGVQFTSTPCANCSGGGTGITINFTNNTLSISGEQNLTFIDFSIGKINQTGTYQLKSDGTNGGKADYLNTIDVGPNGESPYYYDSNNNLPGQITIITFDNINKTISGTFSFALANRYYPNLIKHVTNGTFSITYQ